jgi:hypothetical protein
MVVYKHYFLVIILCIHERSETSYVIPFNKQAKDITGTSNWCACQRLIREKMRRYRGKRKAVLEDVEEEELARALILVWKSIF